MNHGLPRSGEEKVASLHRWRDELGLDHFLKCKVKGIGHNQMPARKNKHQRESDFFTILAAELFSRGPDFQSCYSVEEFLAL